MTTKRVSIPLERLPGLREFAAELLGFDPWSDGRWWFENADRRDKHAALPLHIAVGHDIGTRYLAKLHGHSGPALLMLTEDTAWMPRFIGPRMVTWTLRGEGFEVLFDSTYLPALLAYAADPGASAHALAWLLRAAVPKGGE